MMLARAGIKVRELDTHAWTNAQGDGGIEGEMPDSFKDVPNFVQNNAGGSRNANGGGFADEKVDDLDDILNGQTAG